VTTIPYILDILSQPEHLRNALGKFDAGHLAPLASAIRNNEFDRILLTGMGASLYAAYPAWLILANAGLPALWVDTAELIHHTPGLVTSKTLLWIFSQSGKSAEIVSALELKPATLLAAVNNADSPLARVAQVRVGIHADVELTVSTRTYVNTLAAGQLAALALLGKDVKPARNELMQTASAMEAYLTDWEARVQQIGKVVGFPNRLAVMGRGPSLASTYTGALTLGEASKFLATPYQAGEFRHGPLELTTQDLTALIFAGSGKTKELNQRLFNELRSYNVSAFWIGSEKNEGQIDTPEVPAIGLPLMEIVPMQLLSIHLAGQIGVEPGHFFRTGKITLAE
jgi:glucosamine--fructose-6-phosphate aminotransferase (isomerizing)